MSQGVDAQVYEQLADRCRVTFNTRRDLDIQEDEIRREFAVMFPDLHVFYEVYYHAPAWLQTESISEVYVNHRAAFERFVAFPNDYGARGMTKIPIAKATFQQLAFLLFRRELLKN